MVFVGHYNEGMYGILWGYILYIIVGNDGIVMAQYNNKEIQCQYVNHR